MNSRKKSVDQTLGGLLWPSQLTHDQGVPGSNPAAAAAHLFRENLLF